MDEWIDLSFTNILWRPCPFTYIEFSVYNNNNANIHHDSPEETELLPKNIYAV